MQSDPLEHLKYPNRKVNIPEVITDKDVQKWIDLLYSIPNLSYL